MLFSFAGTGAVLSRLACVDARSGVSPAGAAWAGADEAGIGACGSDCGVFWLAARFSGRFWGACFAVFSKRARGSVTGVAGLWWW